MENEKFIDVEKVLKDKAYKLYKWLPRFAINWLKKKLHEKEINETMRLLKNDKGLEFNRKGLDALGAKVESTNQQLVPKTGSVIIAANHPLGGLDGLALIKSVGEVRPDVRFFVNDILKNFKNYDEIFVAVNKVGASSTSSLRTMEDVFKTECAVLFFPAGLVSRKQNGLVRDLEWKKSFVTQAIDHKRMIQPVFIEGENSKFFYNFAMWRKRLGIKANIEMLFLPDEMFKARKDTIKIHYSKPFDSALLDKRKTDKQWSKLLYQYIYSPEFMQGVCFEDYMKKY
ncbi:MAG: 1-acyl-sn-glycerol-3-phosphate acyltransferase [Bacteroidia bacterium]|jgi:putative hemolysin|nr:1-acyl-sn-glycerol-3-phosphate acyltransferase [Bacteroidia bacterium]